MILHYPHALAILAMVGLAFLLAVLVVRRKPEWVVNLIIWVWGVTMRVRERGRR